MFYYGFYPAEFSGFCLTHEFYHFTNEVEKKNIFTKKA